MGEKESEATVLVVDDNEELADVYAGRLADEYEVQTAYGGQEALDVVDETVDVILLDRRMPAMSGDSVLDALEKRGLDCRVILVTAVDPDFDIVDMPFDEYLHKPVRGEKLLATIERQLEIAEHGETATEFVEVASKIAALERTKSPRELQNDQRAIALREQKDDLEDDVDASVPESLAQ